MKEIIRAILRTSTFMTIFIILMSAIGFAHSYAGIETTFWNTLFWSIACALTSIKIAFIKEDF